MRTSARSAGARSRLKGPIRIGVSGSNQWTRYAIGVHRHCWQETALGADLVHGRAGAAELPDFTGITRVFEVQIQVPEPGLGAIEHPEPEGLVRHVDHRVGSAVDHGRVGEKLGHERRG